MVRDSNEEDITGEHNDGEWTRHFVSTLTVFFSLVSDSFANSDLHYKIPFWIGVIVISLLFLSAIIASIRYCFYTLCSSHTGKHLTHLVSPMTSSSSLRRRRERGKRVNLNANISFSTREKKSKSLLFGLDSFDIFLLCVQLNKYRSHTHTFIDTYIHVQSVFVCIARTCIDLGLF